MEEESNVSKCWLFVSESILLEEWMVCVASFSRGDILSGVLVSTLNKGILRDSVRVEKEKEG